MHSEKEIYFSRGKRENQPYPNSFEALLREGYGKAVEVDLFLLCDGNVAVIHHKDVKLTQGQVEGMTLDELNRVRETGEKAPDRVTPLFEEFVTASFDRDISLVLEIKGSSPERAKQTIGAVLQKLTLLKDSNVFQNKPDFLKKSVEISSFSVEALESGKEILEQKGEDIALGLLWTSNRERASDMEISKTAEDRASQLGCADDWTQCGIEIAKRIGCASVHLHSSVVNADLIQKVHETGLKLVVWGVTGIKDARKVMALGADKCVYDPIYNNKEYTQ